MSIHITHRKPPSLFPSLFPSSSPQVLAGAQCPQLCAYRGAWVVGHQLWVAMELLDGGSLASLLAQPLPERVAAQVTLEHA